MIVQNFLDWLSQLVGGFLQLIPPLPPEVEDALDTLAEGGAFVSSKMGNFGVLVPFDAFATAVQWWLACVALWGVVLLVRLVLWVVNR